MNVLIGITQQRKGYLSVEAPVGNLSCSFRPRSGIAAPDGMKKCESLHLSNRFQYNSGCKSGFADGMSKPIPYGCA